MELHLFCQEDYKIMQTLVFSDFSLFLLSTELSRTRAERVCVYDSEAAFTSLVSIWAAFVMTERQQKQSAAVARNKNNKLCWKVGMESEETR